MPLRYRQPDIRIRSPWLLAAMCLLLLAPGGGASFAQETPQGDELYRIRVANSVGGAIEVSGDGGATYLPVGKVIAPAASLIKGFEASRWAQPGTVAAVAVHGLRLKVRNAIPADPQSPSNSMMMSIVPREYSRLPNGYGGHRPADSGIYTDVPSGQGIFRNLAPLVGSPARLEVGGRLVPFPDDYLPRQGDQLVIPVHRPSVPLREIVFENWKGGQVTAVFEGRDPQPIARVARPVLGVGRFDGTAYTGVGRINTNHSGVITISTAPVTTSPLPEGQGSERRGGIQIEPANHAQAVSYDAPQVMVVEPLEGQGSLEGKPPLFSGYIGLYWDPRSAPHTLSVEVKIDNGPWEPMPEAVGRVDGAFTAAALARHFARLGVERRITSGVTHLRLLFPQLDRVAVARYLAGATSGSVPPPTAGVAPSGSSAAVAPDTTVRGVVTLSATLKNIPDPSRISVVTIYVDSRIVAIMNVWPFRHELDTRRLTNGRHEVEIRALDAGGGIIAQKRMGIVVENAPPQAGAAPAPAEGQGG